MMGRLVLVVLCLVLTFVAGATSIVAGLWATLDMGNELMGKEGVAIALLLSFGLVFVAPWYRVWMDGVWIHVLGFYGCGLLAVVLFYAARTLGRKGGEERRSGRDLP